MQLFAKLVTGCYISAQVLAFLKQHKKLQMYCYCMQLLSITMRRSCSKKEEKNQEKNGIFKKNLNLCASYCILLVAMTTNDSSKTAMPLQSYHSSSLLMCCMQCTQRMRALEPCMSTCLWVSAAETLIQ